MKKKKYMGKIIGLLFFAIYVFITVNLLVLYNYGNEKIVSDVGYDISIMNGCPSKPENLHLEKFFYNSQNERMIVKMFNDEGNYSTNKLSFKDRREIVLNN